MDEEIISMLKEDFVAELEATIVYVRNAFLMSECEASRMTEAISIDEMRHMNWLGSLMVKRGGVPSMKHREPEFGGNDLKSQLEKQLELENRAVERYRNHIERIGDRDREVAGVLRHILDEEKQHRKEFRKLLSMKTF